MSHFAAMKSPLPVAASAAASDTKSPLFCPKPRRPVAPLRCHQSGGYSDAGAGVDLLDLLLSKVGSFCLLAFRSTSSCVVFASRKALMGSCPVGRARRAAVSWRRPLSRRCSAARRRGERQTRWSTTAGSAWTTRPCPCPCRWWPPRCRWPGPTRGRRWRRPCRRAARRAPAPGSRSSPPRSASRVLTASTAAAAAVAMASPPWPRCAYNTK